uniref:hypothetical protein n=1 Tax=Salmonella sp. s39606 TaxID=3159643 RepID=UPI00398166FA
RICSFLLLHQRLRWEAPPPSTPESQLSTNDKIIHLIKMIQLSSVETDQNCDINDTAILQKKIATSGCTTTSTLTLPRREEQRNETPTYARQNQVAQASEWRKYEKKEVESPPSLLYTNR